jgi:DNA-3-methyladenine glycosylase II
MTPILHRRFINLAGKFSPELQAHMKRIGPVDLPNRKHMGAAQFLAQVIIGQQLSTKAARTIWQRIKTAARDADERIPHFFREENIDVIRACGASGNKTKALLAINEATLDGRLAAAKLRRLDSEERSAALLGLRGVGQWTVDMASMFYFGDTDIWPIGDLSVSRTFRDLLGEQHRHRNDGILAEFSPNRSYLAIYMWRIVESVP